MNTNKQQHQTAQSQLKQQKQTAKKQESNFASLRGIKPHEQERLETRMTD
jgi:hypothetical protein